jgi:hypothetical protein
MSPVNTIRAARRYGPFAVVLLSCSLIVALPAISHPEPDEARDVTLVARQYGYEPNRIVVRSGEVLRLRLASEDVVHGFYFEGHDLEAEVHPGKRSFKVREPSIEGAEYREVEEIELIAGRPGKYRYRCSITCGTLHPFMQGELVVAPNRPFHAGIAGTVAISLSAFTLMFVGAANSGTSASSRAPWRLDLLDRFPVLRRLVTRRWFQFAVVVPNAVLLFLFVVAGLFGSPIGNRNIIVTIVWIFWWFVLITVLVPFGGRSWCMACPVPLFGEWFSRRTLVGVRPESETSRSLRTGGMNRRWPKRLSGTWLQNVLFLVLCSFSTILVTRPGLTAVVLAVMVGVALVVHAVFRRRSFCRYLCPLNSWMSLYSMTAMVEVRARDTGVCATCRDRSCSKGTERSWRCPWMVTPSRLSRNNYCGLCMECVKACPNRNVTVRARPFCSDVEVRGFDEAWMAFIMITLVAAYSVTLLGPWAKVREWANVTEVGNWAGFAAHAAVIWFVALVALPAVWYVAARLARPLSGSPSVPVKEIFVRYSYLLVPLGLMAWVAFSVPLMLVNYTHVTSSLSDPLGWGWDLFGTADQPWRPLLPEWIPYVQIPLLLAGLGVALSRGARIARSLYPPRAAALSLIPHGVVCTSITIVLLRLFVG